MAASTDVSRSNETASQDVSVSLFVRAAFCALPQDRQFAQSVATAAAAAAGSATSDRFHDNPLLLCCIHLGLYAVRRVRE